MKGYYYGENIMTQILQINKTIHSKINLTQGLYMSVQVEYTLE